MKNKIAIIYILIMCLLLSACSNYSGGDEDIAGADTTVSGTEEQTPADNDTIEETGEMSENNRAIIAEALGIDEGSRNIRFILRTLDTIGAGEIKSAEAGTDGGDSYLDITAEDDTVYRIYLTGSGSVDAVKNMDTGEWPIKSER